jgi:hypothetical protein
MSQRAYAGDTGEIARRPRRSVDTEPSLDAEGQGTERLAALWGIGIKDWLFAVRIRILFVIDGRINESTDPNEFGLGLVLETLRDNGFAWWVRFGVTVRNRSEPDSFRFTEAGFDIGDFDQVWFFGDLPGTRANPPEVGDDIIEQAGNFPLSDPELRIVAEWMERGGGVFATGDHTLLGASMCYRIPRVRTMRRWTRAQQVPEFGTMDRNETLVHAPNTSELDMEGDRWPQRIFPVLSHDAGHFLSFGASPHPLLCGRKGIIDHFPDHMHEGSVVGDAEVPLNLPLDIPGYAGDEYPIVEPEVSPTVAGVAAVVPPTFGLQPRPRVVAYGLTSHLSAPRAFPMIGAYDGDPAGIGRVVVDSTWHHWFSYNLVGLRDYSPLVYSGMQDYYRNVAMWLATPEQRARMLFWATWGVLVGSQPGAFDAVLGVWGVGQRAVDVLGRTAPQCIQDELVATAARLPASLPGAEGSERYRVWQVPGRTVTTLMVGAIALEMLPEAHRRINEKSQGRDSALDPETIRRLGFAGTVAGRRELMAALGEGSSQLGLMRELLLNQGEAPVQGNAT